VDSRSRLSAALAERYTISRELGRGGMATVYLAHDRKHDRQVALKLLHPELAASLGAERFLHEIRTTAKLTHPHILPLHDSGEVDGLLYYVMPYVEGESLRQRLMRERQLPLEDALRIASDVASALAYAHGHGIVHRDIKPENILLSGGEAVVADFGIARAITAAGGERLTETGLAMGTVAYMSPEQSAADREIDGRSDLYSLGCVLYEMLAGQPPFAGPTAQAIVARRLSEPVPTLQHVREQLPDPVERAIMKALAKVPADRFSSASRFAEALAAGSRPVPHRGTPRQPAVWAVLALLLLAGVAGYLALRSRSTQSSLSAPIAMAVLPFQAVASTEPVDFLSVGIPDAIITRLATVRQMRVRPTSAVLRYQHQPVDAVEAGRALLADFVLTGTVQRAAERIRVNVQLLRAEDGVLLWGERYDLARQDLLTLQDSIAAQVASALEVRMTAAEQERVYRRYTENIGAFETYMRGRLELARGTKEGALAAILAFENALRQDSTYALARAGLAMASADMHLRFASSDDVRQWGERAHREAQQALALDSNLAETHQALAAVYRKTEFNWERTIEESRRALALNPSLELPYYYLASALYHLGLLQSADSVLSEASIVSSENRSEGLRTKGVNALLAGRYAEAASLLSEVRRLRSGSLPDSYLPQAYYYAGDRQRSEALLDSLRHSTAVPAATRARATLASFLAARGDSANAMALLDEVARGSYMDHHVAYSVGAAHAQLGHRDEAQRWLTRAVETGFPSYPWYARDPLLRPFRASKEGATFLSALRQSGEATRRRLELGWHGSRD
jgi:serine/threonine protein kinase/tetratricopeptide (TPR) repeat protein